jgi:transposase
MNTKHHAIADAKGWPLKLFMTAGEVSDYTGAPDLLRDMPSADWHLAEGGCDADLYRKSLKNKGIRVCIPDRKSRKKKLRFDRRLYKRPNRIKIVFGRLKDWRRIATRYDRCPIVFLSTIALAAAVLFWL